MPSRRADWRENAACTQVEPDLFFPEPPSEERLLLRAQLIKAALVRPGNRT
jgi:hypothetical protein